jgi:Tfp pilus assembly protein PilF
MRLKSTAACNVGYSLRNPMRTMSLPLILCLCIQFIAGCTKTKPVFQTKTEDSTGKAAHRVIRIDWRAELAERQKRLERDPNSAFLHNQVAVAYDALGDFDNFDREIQTAIKLDPSNSIDCYVAYAVYKRRHLQEKALSVLEKALQIDPANPLGHYEKAGLLEDAMEWQLALKEYETAQQLLQDVKSNPQNFQQNSWYYTDARANPYDVGSLESSIANDIARVRAAASRR